MVLENPPPPLVDWILPALGYWLFVGGMVGLVALALGFVIAAVVHGPSAAGDMIFKLLSGAIVDIVRISPRRVLALARLAVQESLRRRVLAGLAVYFVILAFAAWFLDSTTPDPAKLFLSFVLTATGWLLLLMMLFLSTFSLPNDIKNHTIYTIVTKPVRPSEIVLGRVIGFAAVGTALLAIMGGASYLFAVRALRHSHELTERDLIAASSEVDKAHTGHTALERNHRHTVSVEADGSGYTDVSQGHWHQITSRGTGDNRRYTLGSPQGQFHARVPIYGELTFFDREGKPAREGINVGNEWTYRSYIEGGSKALARWKFKGVRREDFPDGLRLNMTISVFRTHKGNIEQTVPGSYELRNPSTGLTSAPFNFLAKEFTIDDRLVPAELQTAEGRAINLFDDLVDNGELEIELKCLASGQFFGMARPDLYLLPREGSFEANFAKGCWGIWLQMLLVTAVGVMWSTFLTGPVAMLATFATLIAGFFAPWVRELASGEVIGGNALEALYRTVTQASISTPLENNLTSSVITWVDRVANVPMKALAYLLPDFGTLDDSLYVADGFNIPAFVMTEQTIATLGFVIPACIVGFLCLKMREVAQ